MAVTDTSFSAAIDEWCEQSDQRMTAVFRGSVQEVDALMRKPVGAGGNMPVDTGYLRASRVASTDGPTPMRENAVPEKGKTYTPDDSAFELKVANLTLGQKIWLTFVAAYARRQEYGFKGEDSLGRTYAQNGRGFVRLAAQQWNLIVLRQIERAKQAVGK